MSASRTLRVGLVGCGRIAHVHAGYLRQTPHVTFVGACDTNPESRETFTARWQVPTFADIDEMLSAAAPDAAHVVTPPASHVALAVRLLDAGLHVLVEKPLALSVVEVDRMLAAAQRRQRVLTANHNRWFDPVVAAARNLLDSGRLGALVGVDVFQGAAAGEADPAAGAHWSRALPGGMLYNLGPHPTYLLRNFVGPVQEIQVLSDADSAGQLREVRALVRGAAAVGSLTISLQTQPFMNRLTLYGTAMTAEVNLNNMTLLVRRTRRAPKLVGKVLPNLDEATQLVWATVVNTIEFLRGRQRYYPGMGLHFRALYEALAAGGVPPVSANEAREAVWLMEQIWQRAGASAGGPATEVAA